MTENNNSGFLEDLGFSLENIKTILALLVRDKDFHDRFGPMFEPCYFATIDPEAPHEIMENIFIMAQDFFDRYGNLITREVLKNEIALHFKQFKKDEVRINEWYALVDEIFDAQDLDAVKDYYTDKMAGFLQVQGLKLAFHNVFKDLQKPVFEPAPPIKVLSDQIGKLLELGVKDEKKEFSGITMSEGLNLKIEEPDWIVKPIIERGDKGYLVATYKVGKTLLFQQLTLCLSKKIDFLGFEIPKPRKVVYLRFELKDEKFWKRYMKMNVWEWRKEYLKDPYFEFKRGFNISSKDEKDLQWLFRLIDKQEPEVLLLDPIYKMTDLNLADPKSGILLRSFEKVQNRYPDLTMELAHHKAKTYKEKESESWDSSYGIFQLFADMDHEMRISYLAKDKQFKWDFLTNNEPVDSMILERDPKTLIYSPVTESKVQKKTHGDEAKVEVMRNLLVEHSKETGFLIKSTFERLANDKGIGWRLFKELLEQERGVIWNIEDAKPPKPVKVTPISITPGP